VAPERPRGRALPLHPARTSYATRAGHAQIDRALYLPQSWAGDQDRRAAAGVPADVEFATKPELARQMIVRALDGGAAAPWVTGDEV
jgi:SRSO17 transposase